MLNSHLSGSEHVSSRVERQTDLADREFVAVRQA